MTAVPPVDAGTTAAGRAGPTAPAAAGAGWRAAARHTAVELLLTLRRGESVVLTLGIPVLLLGFFSLTDVLPEHELAADPVDFLAPGVLALAIMSSAMVGLAIATGFERQYRVLKRLGATPLGRRGLLTAKVASVAVLIALQAVVLMAEALALGWRPPVDVAEVGGAVGAAALATVAFGGLGMLMAGTLRAEVTLAAANGLYFVLLLLGGMVIPVAELPSALATVAEALPAAALSDILFGAFNDGSGTAAATTSWIVLAAWAVVAPAAAARWFRWE